MTADPEASLDDRYLAFRDATAPVFAQFPRLEPLRHQLFKNILIGREAVSAKSRLMSTVAALKPRRAVAASPCDVLFWAESARESVLEELIPVQQSVSASGVRAKFVRFRCDAPLPGEVIDFEAGVAAAPGWAAKAWDALGKSLASLREPALKPAFLHALMRSEGLLDGVERLLEGCRPKIAVCAASNLQGGAALMVAARKLGIPTLLLQHGITQVFYTPHLADCMITWGPSSSETLAGLGVDPTTLLPLGSPRHDSMGTGGDPSRLRETLKLPKGPTLVFFSNGNDLIRNGRAPIECAEWLESAAARFSERVNVVVRLHPKEDGALYAGRVGLTLTKDEVSLDDTLAGADVTSSLCSTVLYEALLYRKPVWQFFADGWPELADNWKHGLAERVSCLSRLEALIEGLCTGAAVPASETALARVFANHGRATDAVVEEIRRRLG